MGGQVTIPQEIRKRLGLLRDTEVEAVDDCVQARKARPSAERVPEARECMAAADGREHGPDVGRSPYRTSLPDLSLFAP